jgi:hypothetical protein
LHRHGQITLLRLRDTAEESRCERKGKVADEQNEDENLR